MKRTLWIAACALPVMCVWLIAQPAGDSTVDGIRLVEVASVSDAMEQLYGGRAGVTGHAGCNRRGAGGLGVCDGAAGRRGLCGHRRADGDRDEGARVRGRRDRWERPRYAADS